MERVRVVASALRCDRCGKCYPLIRKYEDGAPRFIITDLKARPNQHTDYESKELDLCPVSSEKLKTFIFELEDYKND